MSRPLEGIRVVALPSIGPVPHAAMMLGRLGAEVLQLTRAGAAGPLAPGYGRWQRVLEVDLKDPETIAFVWEQLDAADVLLEGFRPGVAERLGFGPAECHTRNPGLVYGRMTGWGQTGPLSMTAGHDINYLALTGALHAIGTTDDPIPPLNLVGDFGGGSMLLVTGVLAALVSRSVTSHGQVVDAAMVDGAAQLLQPILDMHAGGDWTDRRADNLIDGGAPFYRAYRCADRKHVAVGAIEPQFYALLVAGLGLELSALPDQDDKASWPHLATRFAAAFATKTRDQWAEVFADSDACVTPVLSLTEAPTHPHIAARAAIVTTEAGLLSGAAPRFS